MSMRNVRKLFGGNELPPLEGNSDEEYEPLYAKASPSKFKYEGLTLGSPCESDHETADAVEIEKSNEDNANSKAKKKKKQRKPKQILQVNSTKNIEVLDEIDKSVMEVNAVLGTPPPAPSVFTAKDPADPWLHLSAVQAKYLNPNNELKKLFGPEEPGNRRRGRQPNANRLLKKAMIVPITGSINIQKSGLSMSIHRRENCLTFFAFDHSREYQKIHSAFLSMPLENYRNVNLAMSIEEAQNNMHVEAMLENADSLFRFEAYSAANTLIEQIIAYMQYVAHPSFNLTDPNVRLEYKITENRPFHIAVLKYLYLLTNRACHRTALELAKLLLKLDPSDPLAVLFIIDTVALRAREHQWLIDAVAHWSTERDAGFMFNIQYSNALAHFHVATKKGEAELSKADELIQAAMLRFPGIVFKLLQSASVSPSARLRDCALFAKADDTTGKNLRELMALYAKFTWAKWREPGVFEWFTKNAELLADKYDNNTATQEQAKELANERLNLFQGWPEEVVRHLSVIKPMSHFLVEGAVPRVNRARSADPVPPAGGMSRYGYDRVPNAATNLERTDSSLYEFVLALPNYALPPPQEFPRRIAEYDERNEEVLVQALLGGQHNVHNPAIVAEEFDDNVEENDDDPTDDDNAVDVGDSAPANLVMSVEFLSNALRHFMGVIETRRDPNEPRDATQESEPDRPNAD